LNYSWFFLSVSGVLRLDWSMVVVFLKSGTRQRLPRLKNFEHVVLSLLRPHGK